MMEENMVFFLLFFEAEKLLQYIYLMRFYFRDKLGFIRVQMWRDDAVSTPNTPRPFTLYGLTHGS